MANHVDYKYVMLLSSRLPLFKVKSNSPHKVNFRCPICGDSQKSKYKTRGWILEKEGKYMYYCHNCGYSNSLGGFLKTFDHGMYNDYVSDLYVKNIRGDSYEDIKDSLKKEKKVYFDKNPLKTIKKLSQLIHTHPARKFIDNRKIPPAQHYRIYYAPKFRSWINSLIPDKLPSSDRDEPRIILPMFNREKMVVGISARGFDPKGLRYITIMFDEDQPKMFGLEVADMNKKYFVVEGAFDSLFLSNSVAMVGADANYDSLNNKENAIFVFDAEPRNLEICKRIKKVIDLGYKVCIWPPDVKGKDINEMILNGMQNIESVITNNSFGGLEASLKLSQWRKI